MPIFTRGKSREPFVASSMMLRMPLCPPCDPLTLTFISPKFVSKSSYTITTRSFGIWYAFINWRTLFPLKFINVCGLHTTHDVASNVTLATNALRSLAYSPPHPDTTSSITSKPTLCFVLVNLAPGFPNPQINHVDESVDSVRFSARNGFTARATCVVAFSAPSAVRFMARTTLPRGMTRTARRTVRTWIVSAQRVHALFEFQRARAASELWRYNHV